MVKQESDSIALSLHQRRLSPDDVELCVISLKESSPKLPPLLRKMMPARMVVVSRTIRMAITTLKRRMTTLVREFTADNDIERTDDVGDVVAK